MNPHLMDYSKLSITVMNTAPAVPTSNNNPASPTRPKHLSTRSISEIAGIPKVHRHHHHHPHLHHRDKDKHKEKEGDHISLILEQERSKSEGVTPNESRNVSRRESVNVPWEDSVAMGSWQREKRPVKEGEVREERDRGVMRATELRNSVNELNTLSNNTTRRLDNTYYSVLEKLSMLQSTISSLKELATMTRALNTDFQAESEELVRDVNGQLESFDGFTAQEQRIADLQQRVKAGRDRIKALGTRVDVVKDRVEGWGKAEGEWQERTRKNLRMMWVIMSIILAIILAIVAFHYTPAMTSPSLETPKALNTTGLLGKIPDFESLKNESQALKREIEERLEKSAPRAQPDDDPRLRLFDEL